MRKQIFKGLLIASFSIGLGACSQFAANSTVRIMGQASPALQSFSDPALAEASLPYSITQMEGLLLVVPNNTSLRINLMRALGSYGFGFLEERLEVSERADDEERMEHYRARATAMYLRAKAVGFETLTQEEDGDGGADGAVRRGIDAWRSYLQRFDDREQVGMIFWTGYAWARHINLNKERPRCAGRPALRHRDASSARFQLDPTFNNYAPYARWAAYYARTAASLGGEPGAGARDVRDGHRGTGSVNFLTYKVMMARVYAVMVQDRALYTRLLQEVIDAGDVMPEQRLANQIAKRRARRYLAQIDDLIRPRGARRPGATPRPRATPRRRRPRPGAPAPAAPLLATCSRPRQNQIPARNVSAGTTNPSRSDTHHEALSVGSVGGRVRIRGALFAGRALEAQPAPRPRDPHPLGRHPRPRGLDVDARARGWNRELRRRTNKALRCASTRAACRATSPRWSARSARAASTAGSVTAVGLAQVHRPALVFQMPGMFRTNAQLDAARAGTRADIVSAFDTGGLRVHGLGRRGLRRCSPTRPGAHPGRHARPAPYVWRDDLVMPRALHPGQRDAGGAAAPRGAHGAQDQPGRLVHHLAGGGGVAAVEHPRHAHARHAHQRRRGRDHLRQERRSTRSRPTSRRSCARRPRSFTSCSSRTSGATRSPR
jgi:hypothetical protein